MATKIHVDLDDQFCEIFSQAGGTNLTCNCGREHISMIQMEDWEFYDDEQSLEMLQASYVEMAALDDNLILDYDNHGFSMIEVAGFYFVDGCECEGWRPYMDFLFEERKYIAQFLLAANGEVKKLQSQADLMDMIAKEYDLEK